MSLIWKLAPMSNSRRSGLKVFPFSVVQCVLPLIFYHSFNVVDVLKNDRSFVLDCGDEFYVWHGGKISVEDRTEANSKAEELFKSKPRESWVEIERASQGISTFHNFESHPLL
jgi:hypothetical protein